VADFGTSNMNIFYRITNIIMGCENIFRLVEEHSSFPQDILRNIALSNIVKSHEKLLLFYQLTDEFTLGHRLCGSDLYVTATISVRIGTGYGLHSTGIES
jgi:hypothetical protein